MRKQLLDNKEGIETPIRSSALLVEPVRNRTQLLIFHSGLLFRLFAVGNVIYYAKYLAIGKVEVRPACGEPPPIFCH